MDGVSTASLPLLERRELLRQAIAPAPPEGHPVGASRTVRGRIVPLLPDVPLLGCMGCMAAPKLCSTAQEVGDILAAASARVSGGLIMRPAAVRLELLQYHGESCAGAGGGGHSHQVCGQPVAARGQIWQLAQNQARLPQTGEPASLSLSLLHVFMGGCFAHGVLHLAASFDPHAVRSGLPNHWGLVGRERVPRHAVRILGGAGAAASGRQPAPIQLGELCKSERGACKSISWLVVPQLPNFRVCRWGLGSRTTSGPSSTTASWATALKPDRPATSECYHQPGLQEPQRSGPSSSLINLELSHRLAALKGRLPNRHAGLCATQCPSRTCGFATRSSRWCWRCMPTCASLPAVRTPQSTACASRDSSASGLATYCGAALPRSVGYDRHLTMQACHAGLQARQGCADGHQRG
jgi:hypothetical protein